jgi:hypothetical protein
MKRYIPMVLVIVGFSCARVPEAGSIAGEVVEVGAFELGPGKPGTREAHFTTHGNVFFARLGLQFGFRFKLKNVPAGTTINLETVVTHPPIVDMRGKTRIRYELLTIIPVTNGSATSVTGYKFDRPEEMTPGVWTFQHSFRGKPLITQSFMIRAPDTGIASQ